MPSSSLISAEFTKKTKIPITSDDTRSEAKLRLAVDHTKRTLSASAGAASCSVESLKDGIDFSGSINRLRFDLLLAAFYTQITGHISALLESARLQKEQVHEIMFVGGSAGLTGLVEKVGFFFGESSGVIIRDDIDPSEALVKGSVLQAKLLLEISTEGPLHAATAEDDHSIATANTSSYPIGIVFPGDHDEALLSLVVIPAETPLPVRRTVRVGVSKHDGAVGFEVWEGVEVVKVVQSENKPAVKGDDDEEDEEDEEEAKEVVVEKKAFIRALKLAVNGDKLDIRISLDVEGKLEVEARESGGSDWVRAA